MDCGGTAKLRCSGTLICQNFLRRPFHKKPGSTRANTGTPSSHRTTQCFGLMRFECHVSTLLCKGMKTALEIRSIPAVLFARSAAQAVEVLLRQRAYVVKRVGNGEGMANGSPGQVSWKKHGATGGWISPRSRRIGRSTDGSHPSIPEFCFETEVSDLGDKVSVRPETAGFHIDGSGVRQTKQQ